MPEIGEIKHGWEIGKSPTNRFIWHTCVDCGKERWVQLRRSKVKSPRCRKCSKVGKRRGKQNPMWKGGHFLDKKGYVLVKLNPDDFFYPMANKLGYVREHRLVVAKALGRCLHLWELVHHKKGYVKDDNRYPETLQLVTDERHEQITLLENRINYLEQRVTILEAENALLEGKRNLRV